jgi:GntR family transcriptional regulator/MocR family aminotransferase
VVHLAKAETFQDLSLIPPSPGEELWRWLYGELRAAILDGRLSRGARLPSTRSLAKQYKVARGTVMAAFDQLQSEGYTRAEVGGGTYVRSGLPDHAMSARKIVRAPNLPQSTADLSRRGLQMIEGVRLLPSSCSIAKAFRTYEPAVDLFPVDLWSRVAGRVLRKAPRSLYGNGNAAGYQPLRKAIADYVGSARGVRCSADQVVITSGAQQALDLAARILLDPGDRVWMEDPGYPGTRFAFRAAGARLIPVPVDDDGLDVQAARKLAPSARMAYVTPANQFPLGVTMSLDRRFELLQWAVKSGAWIVEDEYDAEYRYFGRPVAALQSLDRSGCVIYIGTFTKMLFNALRLGFLVLPERLVSAFEQVRSFTDRHPPTLDQAILSEFILDGHFGHHVRRMRQVYAERASVLQEAARKKLSGSIDVVYPAAGMRAIGWLAPGIPADAVLDRGRSLGLELTAVAEFSHRHRHPPALVLGFAACSPAELRRGIDVLADVFRRLPETREDSQI